MRPWTPTRHVIDGVLATDDDLRAATAKLASITGSRVIVATFSVRYLLPSASWAHAREDEAWGEETINSLHSVLHDHLRNVDDGIGFVEYQALERLREAGTVAPSMLTFGGNLERSGRLAVVVAAGGRLREPDAAEQAALCAACALGSRPAAFSRDNAIEGSVQRAELAAIKSASGGRRSDAAQSLLDFARDALGASTVVVYEGDEIHHHRATALELVAASPVGERPAWLPERVDLPAEVVTPPAPERGGSHFSELGELAAICAVNNKRLLGVVADNPVFGLPYGFDPVTGRRIGVLCVVWNSDDERRIGVHEMAVARVVALHMARDNDERRRQDSVQLVTSQLSFISALQPTTDLDAKFKCAPSLRFRQDVKLVAAPVSEILRGLADLSGAMSATCRLIAGADGPPLSRHLLRLHCEGESSADASPDAIPLADASRSVNAWVAVHRDAVHLKDLRRDPETGRCTSPDLSRYEGLDSVVIYRDDVAAELCVPIFAERRIVGTVNLEARERNRFDTTARLVEEYAQLIGIALLEARRRISVDTVTEASGFLDHRHVLESGLLDLTERVGRSRQLSRHRQRAYQSELRALHRSVLMSRPTSNIPSGSDMPSVAEVLHAAMASVGWADTDRDLTELLLDRDDCADDVLTAQVTQEAAQALAFAVRQALRNVRRHGGGGEHVFGRSYLAMFRCSRATVGGVPNLYVAVSSTCRPAALREVDPQRIFREPITHAGQQRTSLGTYLAGESVRRCGGSAYFREHPHDDDVMIVDAEFCVPEAPAVDPQAPPIVLSAASHSTTFEPVVSPPYRSKRLESVLPDRAGR